MKAAVLYGKEDLKVVEDFEDPTYGDNDVLIAPAAVGLCSTDRTLYRGFVPFKPPLIIGHEVAGVVKEKGASVTELEVGDHVIVPPVYPGCGDESCPHCKEGLSNRCKRSVFIGHGVNGGQAELMAAPAKYSFKVNTDVPLDEVCIVPDAVSTPFHALRSRSIPSHVFLSGNWKELTAKETHWLRGKNVVVFGVGGVGGPTVNLAKNYFGAKNVIAVDIADDKLDYAKRLGATHLINTNAYYEENNINMKELDGRERGKAMSGFAKHISSHLAEDKFQVDLVLDTSGVPVTFPVALETVSKNRTIIQVGWPPRPVENFLSQKVMSKYLTITGTWACPMHEMTECVQAVNDGLVDLSTLVTNKDYTLETLEQAIFDLEEGKILGRASTKVQ